jgi:hypothetical protein
MYRIIDSRSSGKTSRLMLLAKENNSVIACSNPYAMREKALGYGITGLTIVSYEDILNKDNDYLRGRTVMIDEIESFVQYQLFTKLTGYTLSNED